MTTAFRTSRRALLGTALAAPLIRGAAAQGGGGEPYVIGAVFPLSGPNAEYGGVFTAGVQLALQHMEGDRMLKRPVRFQPEDSQALPQQGVIAMNKLVNVDRAHWVLSAFTAVSKAVAPVGDRAKTVMVNGGAVGPDLSGLSPYFWNVIPLAHLETRALLPYLVGERKAKRVALVYVDDPLGDAILGILRQELPKAGGELVGSFSVPRSAQQFGPVAARVRQVRPDAVYIASFGAQQSQIIKGLRDNGVSQLLCSYSAMNLESVRSLPEANGLIFTGQKVDFQGGDVTARRFAEDFRRANGGKEPTIYNVNYYNATRLFGLLAAEVEKVAGQVNGDSLREALLRVRSFPLVGGTGEFDELGNMTAAIEVNEWRDGALVRLAG
jgi:branched-chain amino acid transport system substrate-binding protein